MYTSHITVTKMSDAKEEVAAQDLTRTLKDLGAGAAGGVAQVLLGELRTISNCWVSVSWWSVAKPLLRPKIKNPLYYATSLLHVHELVS